jgi:multiple inositol-polyphosphate phosphatase / 2,3-bisphosphoglycerate 3-phosphatase
MKFLLVFFNLFFVVLITKAQIEYLNTKTPYHPLQEKLTPAPGGYKAVFINYTGRHGSRFQTSAENDMLITDILLQAKNENDLTDEGKIIYQKLLSLQQIEKGNYGNLTKLGQQEQHDIAKRMQAENPSVFDGGKLMVYMTEKLRTQQSAKTFLSGLKSYDSTQIDSKIFPAGTDSILRFYDLSEAYKMYTSSSEIKNHLDSLMTDNRTATAANNVCKKIFTTTFLSKLNNGGISSNATGKTQVVNTIIFSRSLYEIYASMFSASEELQSNYKVFSKQDLLWFNIMNSASDFYEKGPAENTNGIQVIIAAPLLRDLINTTDSAIQFKNFDAVLRFTHAEAISPLATLMRIPLASKTSNSVFTFSNVWNASEIIPMSANIQWILYSNGKNFLIKILLNEKEVPLPVDTKTFPYYNWNDVRSYYLNKLSAIIKN